MPTTMQLISAQTLTSATGSVTFSSIPQTFTDLKVVISARANGSSNWQIGVTQFNTDTTAGNYPSIILYGYNSSAGSQTANQWGGGYVPNSTQTANTFSNTETYITNYAANGVAKSISVDSIAENNATNYGPLQLTAMRWSGTAPITQIVFTPDNGSFVAGSSFYLYGISSDTTTQNTSGPYAFGGDTITTDGTYWYHAFTNSNSFTPLKNLTADVMVVAGGGGGGANQGGGGGAGGFRVLTSQNLSSNEPYSCTIGAGGAGVSYGYGPVAPSGTNSLFSGSGISTISSTGGGGGANQSGPATGGSGGGASANVAPRTGAAGNAGSYSPVEGYAGGNASTGPNTCAGGGGAGGVGGSYNTSPTPLVGGIGTSAYSSWGLATNTGENISGTVYYAGGGGGGTEGGSSVAGGYGGGGTAGYNNGPTRRDGLANTGGGGGGQPAGGGNTGTSGGSGIIIVRYAV